MIELHYETTARILESWDMARRKCKDFEKEFGNLMVNKFVELYPRAKHFYGHDKNPEAGRQSQKVHANAIVEFLRVSCKSLVRGPDTEFLEEILHAVGERHGKLGVLPCYFPYLGQGILFALEETLGPEEWTDEYREAWEQVYELISTEMIKAILQTE